MPKQPEWARVVPSVEQALYFANSIPDADESRKIKEEIIEYAYMEQGIPARKISELIKRAHEEEK